MTYDSRETRETYRQLLMRGIAHAKAKEAGSAQHFLERVIDGHADLNVKAEAAYWMARIATTRSDARNWLEECLGMNPTHGEARRALLILSGKLKKEEVINPDRPPQLSTDTHSSEGQRFECPNCGSRMVYTADGSRLHCEYCDTSSSQQGGNGIDEVDFAVGISTAGGHQHAVAMQSFECVACGAVYLLEPQTSSLTCAHCDSVYAIDKRQTVSLQPPEAIIPFGSTAAQADERANEWLAGEGIQDARNLHLLGVFLPVWTFDVSGALEWRCQVFDNKRDTWTPRTGSKLVMFDDILIPASRPMSRELAQLLFSFDKDDLIDYDASYIAGWLAETYQVTMSDAALDARAIAQKRTSKLVEDDLWDRHRDLYVSSNGLVLETFKLALLPVWLGKYTVEDKEYDLFINGHTMACAGTQPAKGIRRIVDWFLGDE